MYMYKRIKREILHSGISVMDKVKINEHKVSIAIGPHTEFKVIWTFLPEDVHGEFEPHGYRALQTSAPCLCKDTYT